jgi:hypothetical protein
LARWAGDHAMKHGNAQTFQHDSDEEYTKTVSLDQLMYHRRRPD